MQIVAEVEELSLAGVITTLPHRLYLNFVDAHELVAAAGNIDPAVHGDG